MNTNLSVDSHDLGRRHLTGRVVVVSPHLDDGIMSLGATIARAVQAGAKVKVLTAFAYIPSSSAPAGPWDSQCGYVTEGQAAITRREEDRQACLALGAESQWLDFGAEPYERRGSEDDIWSAVTSAIGDSDAVLIPGFPLTQPDHACLSELLLRKGLSCPRIALYAEQPYLFTQRKTPFGSAVAAPLGALIGASPVWTRMPADRAHRRAKFQAVRSYRTQLRHLGLAHIGIHRMLWREAVQGGEAIAWLS